MRLFCVIPLIIVCGVLAACGNQDLFSSKGIGSWTPQYSQVTQYFPMNNSAFGDGVAFNGAVGDFGYVKNANGTGMSATNGVVNTAVQFDGVDDRVSIPFYSSRNSNIFSVSLWVKISAVSGHRCILTTRDDSPARGYSICIDGSGQAEVKLGQGGSAGNWTTATTTPLLLNSWVHIAVTYDGAILRVYKNGVLEASPGSVYVVNMARPMYIGAGGTELDPSASDFFDGILDELAIWTSVLTAADVQAIYVKQLP